MRWNNQDIPDNNILSYIENNARFRKKVLRLIGQITGGQKHASPEQLSAAGRAGATARWTKDSSPRKTAEHIPDDIGNR